MLRTLVLALIVLAGLATTGVSGFYLLHDWAMLGRAYGQFERLARSGADARTLMVADFYHDAFRLNCFAEGVGVLLGALLAAVGLHGLCLLPAGPRDRP
jgi:hypothetical protein